MLLPSLSVSTHGNVVAVVAVFDDGGGRGGGGGRRRRRRGSGGAVLPSKGYGFLSVASCELKGSTQNPMRAFSHPTTEAATLRQSTGAV